MLLSKSVYFFFAKANTHYHTTTLRHQALVNNKDIPGEHVTSDATKASCFACGAATLSSLHTLSHNCVRTLSLQSNERQKGFVAQQPSHKIFHVITHGQSFHYILG